MYDAIDIAHYIIDYYDKKDVPVSNLKLQKLLFYIQAEFVIDPKINRPCFRDEIEAWKHGPVVRAVYREYNVFLSGPILSIEKCKANVTPEHKVKINDILDKLESKGAWDLVSDTHKEDVWKEAYAKGINTEITVSDLREKYESIG